MTSRGIAETAIQIDGICDRFESDWAADPNVRIESYLPESLELQDPYLRGLLPLEISLRRDALQQVDLLEYAFRFPRSVRIVFDEFQNASQSTLNRSPFSQFSDAIVQSAIRRLSLQASDTDDFHLTDTALLAEIQSDRPYSRLGWLALVRRAIGSETQSLQCAVPTEDQENQLANLTGFAIAAFSPRRQAMLRDALSGSPQSQVAKSHGFTQNTLTQTFRTMIEALQ